MSGLDGDGAAAPPRTGDPEIDQALIGLADLPEAPLVEHHDRLARVHEVLHRALDRTDEPGSASGSAGP